MKWKGGTEGREKEENKVEEKERGEEKNIIIEKEKLKRKNK
jgi:hypothetical protein